MADNKRLNLDLDMDTSELLKNVREATSAVSKAATCKSAEDAKCKQRKTTLFAILAVCAVVLVLLVAVFATPKSDNRTAQNVAVTPPSSSSTLEVKQTNKIPTTQSTPATGYTSGSSSYGVRQPADDYEQPYEDPGM